MTVLECAIFRRNPQKELFTHKKSFCQTKNPKIRRIIGFWDFDLGLFLQPLSLCTRQLHIFTSRRQLTIVCIKVLNFCVRHGNRWFHFIIITGFLGSPEPSKLNNLIPTTPISYELSLTSLLGQTSDLLVSVRYMHYCTSTPDLSTT